MKRCPTYVWKYVSEFFLAFLSGLLFWLFVCLPWIFFGKYVNIISSTSPSLPCKKKWWHWGHSHLLAAITESNEVLAKGNANTFIALFSWFVVRCPLPLPSINDDLVVSMSPLRRITKCFLNRCNGHFPRMEVIVILFSFFYPIMNIKIGKISSREMMKKNNFKHIRVLNEFPCPNYMSQFHSLSASLTTKSHYIFIWASKQYRREFPFAVNSLVFALLERATSVVLVFWKRTFPPFSAFFIDCFFFEDDDTNSIEFSLNKTKQKILFFVCQWEGVGGGTRVSLFKLLRTTSYSWGVFAFVIFAANLGDIRI